MRSLIAVIAGWVVFGVSAAMLFQLSGRDPHEPATIAFMIGSGIYGAVFAAAALAGGFVAAARRP